MGRGYGSESKSINLEEFEKQSEKSKARVRRNIREAEGAHKYLYVMVDRMRENIFWKDETARLINLNKNNKSDISDTDKNKKDENKTESQNETNQGKDPTSGEPAPEQASSTQAGDSPSGAVSTELQDKTNQGENPTSGEPAPEQAPSTQAGDSPSGAVPTELQDKTNKKNPTSGSPAPEQASSTQAGDSPSEAVPTELQDKTSQGDNPTSGSPAPGTNAGEIVAGTEKLEKDSKNSGQQSAKTGEDDKQRKEELKKIKKKIESLEARSTYFENEIEKLEDEKHKILSKQKYEQSQNNKLNALKNVDEELKSTIKKIDDFMKRDTEIASSEGIDQLGSLLDEIIGFFSKKNSKDEKSSFLKLKLNKSLENSSLNDLKSKFNYFKNDKQPLIKNFENKLSENPELKDKISIHQSEFLSEFEGAVKVAISKIYYSVNNPEALSNNSKQLIFTLTSLLRDKDPDSNKNSYSHEYNKLKEILDKRQKNDNDDDDDRKSYKFDNDFSYDSFKTLGSSSLKPASRDAEFILSKSDEGSLRLLGRVFAIMLFKNNLSSHGMYRKYSLDNSPFYTHLKLEELQNDILTTFKEATAESNKISDLERLNEFVTELEKATGDNNRNCRQLLKSIRDSTYTDDVDKLVKTLKIKDMTFNNMIKKGN